MFRQMEKLIELLNEYKGKDEWTIECGVPHNDWYSGYAYEHEELIIISKQYGFIQRLVENEKIKPLRKFIGWETDEDEPYIQFDLVDQYIAYLSIQDEPIEFLVSILK